MVGIKQLAADKRKKSKDSTGVDEGGRSWADADISYRSTIEEISQRFEATIPFTPGDGINPSAWFNNNEIVVNLSQR